MRTSPRTPTIVTIALLGGLLLAGCSSTYGEAEVSDAADSAGSASLAVEGADSAGGASGPQVGSSVPDQDREIITTGALTLVAADPRSAVQAISELVEAAGGRVESRAEQVGDDGRAVGSLTIRVPAAKVTATVDALDGIGEVRDVSLDTEDVTATAVDLDARIQALGTSVARLQTLMAESSTTADLLAAENELTTRQAELESLQSQRRSITDQVDMSTLTVEVLSQAPTAQIRPGGFLGGLAAGWGALLVALNALVVAVGAALPWLVAAAIVLVVVRGVLRGLRRGPAQTPRSGPGAPPPSDDPDGPTGGPGNGPQESAPLVGSGGRRG